MWLISQKVKGIEPPATLTPEMVPPCMRGKQESQVVSFFFFVCLYLAKTFTTTMIIVKIINNKLNSIKWWLNRNFNFFSTSKNTVPASLSLCQQLKVVKVVKRA